jgi:hypothetical protein
MLSGMESSVFVCSACGEQRNSKRALKRHMRCHSQAQDAIQPRDDEPNDCQSPSLAETHVDEIVAEQVLSVVAPKQAIEVATQTCSNGTGASSTNGRVNAAPFGFSLRRQIDAIVVQLKQRHMQDCTYLSKSTRLLVEELHQKSETGSIPLDVCMGIVVAAKHFAGTRTPHRPAVEATQQEPACQASLKPKTIRRKLFDGNETPKSEGATIDNASTVFNVVASEPVLDDRGRPAQIETTGTSSSAQGTAETGTGASATARPVDVTSVEPVSSVVSEDHQWILDTWKSYGTREILPPEQMGYAWSPSVALGADSPPAVMTPVSAWSSPDDSVYWGPASPGMPKPNQTRKRHPCRPRRSDCSRCETQFASQSLVAMDWDIGIWRPVHLEDIRLPERPAYEKELQRVRRVLLQKNALPRGCRIQPSRSAKRRRVTTTASVDEKANKRICQERANVVASKLNKKTSASRLPSETPPVNHSSRAASPEIYLIVSDDEL